MEAHHGKGPMDGTGGTIENQVFQEIKSDKLSVRTPKEFSDAAQKLVPYITLVYLPLSEILEEPDNINQAPKIPETLQNTQGEKQQQPVWNPINRILNLPNEELPYHTCYYGKPVDSDVYGHRKSNADEKTCDHYFKKYGEHKKEEWLQCPICTYWFHHKRFHIQLGFIIFYKLVFARI